MLHATYKQIPFDGPYGTKSEKMACPLSALIEARFTDFSQEGKDYPDVSVLEKKFVSQEECCRRKLPLTVVFYRPHTDLAFVVVGVGGRWRRFCYIFSFCDAVCWVSLLLCLPSAR